MSSNGNNRPSASGINTQAVAKISLLAVVLSCLLLYKSADPFQFLPTSFTYIASSPPLKSCGVGNRSSSTSVSNIGSSRKSGVGLEEILQNASMENKTVIITTLNQAWAEPNSIFDLFLESFRIGEGTQKLVRHLVVVCLDPNAYARCLELHPHCYALTANATNFSSGEAFFMTPAYLKMMWKRIDFLTNVLQMGYSFVFTDADIMWLRDPFPRFIPDADFQIACDNFYGNSYDVNNRPNGGFTYVRSTNRSIEFYKFWYVSRRTYPRSHDQDVFNRIKRKRFLGTIGMQLRFLDTVYFGGFCEPSRDFNKVCTMHANCCVGLGRKVHDLKLVLEDWRNYVSLPSGIQKDQKMSWSVPSKCTF